MARATERCDDDQANAASYFNRSSRTSLPAGRRAFLLRVRVDRAAPVHTDSPSSGILQGSEDGEVDA
jgi:hypothetical protein